MLVRPRLVASAIVASICPTRASRSATAWVATSIREAISASRISKPAIAAPLSPTWAATSWAYTPVALMTARPPTRAIRTARQTHAVARHRLASHPAVTSLDISIATAIPTTAKGAPGNNTTMPLIENHAATVARPIAAP